MNKSISNGINLTFSEMKNLKAVTACLSFFLPIIFALEMPFLVKNITNKDIYLKLQNVQSNVQLEEFVRYNISFSGGKMAMQNISLDERCARGLPLSVRWTNYGPYGSLVRGLNRSFEGQSRLHSTKSL